MYHYHINVIGGSALKHKLISALFFVVCIIFGFTFAEILLNPHEDFGDALTRYGLPFLTLITGILGTVFWVKGTAFEKREKTFATLLIIATVVYGICLIGILFGTADRTRANAGIHASSLVPFRTIYEYFKGYNSGRISLSNACVNIIGNLLLFCPIGFILPYFFDGLRHTGWFSIVTLCGLCLVEIMQHITARGNMDIDDVILNFAGAFIVFLLTWNRRAEQLWIDVGIIDEFGSI